MSLADLLEQMGSWLSFSGGLLMLYMIPGAIISLFMRKWNIFRTFLIFTVIGIIFSFGRQLIIDMVFDARLPLIFDFCVAVVGLFSAAFICLASLFSPSIVAFSRKQPGRRWILMTNLILIFVGPLSVLLFIPALKDPKVAVDETVAPVEDKSVATVREPESPIAEQIEPASPANETVIATPSESDETVKETVIANPSESGETAKEIVATSPETTPEGETTGNESKA